MAFHLKIGWWSNSFKKIWWNNDKCSLKLILCFHKTNGVTRKKRNHELNSTRKKYWNLMPLIWFYQNKSTINHIKRLTEFTRNPFIKTFISNPKCNDMECSWLDFILHCVSCFFVSMISCALIWIISYLASMAGSSPRSLLVNPLPRACFVHPFLHLSILPCPTLWWIHQSSCRMCLKTLTLCLMDWILHTAPYFRPRVLNITITGLHEYIASQNNPIDRQWFNWKIVKNVYMHWVTLLVWVIFLT